MRITGIETFKFWVDWMNWLFVRIDTDEGLCGWGEGSLHGGCGRPLGKPAKASSATLSWTAGQPRAAYWA